MKKRKLICCTMLVLLCLSLAACSEKAENTAPAGSPEPETIREEKPDTSSTGIFDELVVGTFQVSSEDLQDGIWNSIITNTENGSNVSPQLSWEEVPGAACYVIYMTDITAGNWIHWKSNNITSTTLEQGWAPEKEYIGPYPPGGTHTYDIYVVAIKEPVESAVGAFNSDNPRFKPCVLKLDTTKDGQTGNILAYGHISGTYTNGD
ncbi:MAG: phosphatidylethanolamine-binding protein [Lachnospiraceae bacterium]|nr:phosphatidylethanolamine-binding protein [Lachnospiraceae bacterium]